MKILEICNFSKGISGVWTRAFEDARNFIKRGYEVHIFSSNIQENGELTVSNQEIKEGVVITRFPVKRRQGYALWFDFEKEALQLNPDIIICHGLRKPYLKPAVKIARKIGAKCFLVTHAPFSKEVRSKKLNILVWLYDNFYGKKIMNSFDKVITICKWEKEHLLRLGCNEKRIVHIPNSIPEEFFNQEKTPVEKNRILYFGRVHPIKNLEVLINACKLLNIKPIIVGSIEKNYKLDAEIKEPIYDLKKKIELIDSAEIFVLPSKKESLPFTLLEAMARGKIVISTNTMGGKELIEFGKNGFLFDIGDSYGLKLTLDVVIKMSEEKKNEIRKEAIKTSERFRSSKIITIWGGLFKDGINKRITKENEKYK